ncbi:hypothetical protein EGM88_10605 [Aureibaculum marinum]|uniref:Uncharacterized protein n=1 Tax=Aureibaculum marinum TaxID=2487930 RepID=A0A3N4NNZ3_9FLAO|nr:hypothetical protein [Aureibaculum marinum]RPD96207.1 hypothetical protein EGM88_10605 [Aureibaculum marinum]
MEDPIEELRKKVMESLTAKTSDWKENVYSSQQYQQEIKALETISMDFVNTIRTISIYSTRGGDIYTNFLCIRTIDDLIQSAIGIKTMIENGIHNTVRRELRYLIEMTTKYVLVDYEKMGESFSTKTEYLRDNVPNSSIEVVEDYSTPFSGDLKNQFRSEIKDFFYKSCAYVHPSKKQIDEQMNDYKRGNTIGFESAKMFTEINKMVFRAYDMILVMVFHSFGHSMSKDLFEQIFDEDSKWKFHKGKYVKEFRKTLFS